MPSTVDVAYITTMREALTQFHADVAKFLADHGHEPSPGSKATIELQTYSRNESIVSAWGIGVTLIEFGSDHLTAFVKHATEPVEPIASWTCVRSMLESCALAAWLFDPTVDVQTRVGRTFALRYEGLSQQATFGRTANLDTADITAIETRIDDVERVALGLGFAPVLDRKSRRIGIAQQVPKATNMISEVLDEGKMYRLLSAVAHGHFWAIQGLGYSPVDVNVDIGGLSAKAFTKTANLDGFGLLGLCVFRSLALPLWNYCDYFGWDKLRLEETFETIADCLRMSLARRFWRS